MVSDVARLPWRTASGSTSTKGVAHLTVDGIEDLIEAHVLNSTQEMPWAWLSLCFL